VIDAVAHLGVRHIDLPCTPERVWATIRDARAGTLADPWSEPPTLFARLRADADAPSTEDAAGAAAADGI
jgi:carbon-monoxide dehydrogenase large subunit